MDSAISDHESQLRKARRLGVIFIAYAIVLPFIALILHTPEAPMDLTASVISWAMMIMMPIELLFIYLLHRHVTKRPTQITFMGQAILMYTFAMAPSVYAVVTAFIGFTLGSLAIPLGLAFSLTGFWLALHFLSNPENVTLPETDN